MCYVNSLSEYTEGNGTPIKDGYVDKLFHSVGKI